MRLQNCSWINRKIILSAHLKFVPFHTYLLDLVFLDIYCSGLQTVLDSQHQQSSADLSKKNGSDEGELERFLLKPAYAYTRTCILNAYVPTSRHE